MIYIAGGKKNKKDRMRGEELTWVDGQTKKPIEIKLLLFGEETFHSRRRGKTDVRMVKSGKKASDRPSVSPRRKKTGAWVAGQRISSRKKENPGAKRPG